MSSVMTGRRRAIVHETERWTNGQHAKAAPSTCGTRVTVELDVKVEWNGRRVAAIAYDLGVGGMAAHCNDPPPHGAHVDLSFDHHGTRLKVPAIVRWSEERGFGLQFGQLGAYETCVIAGLVARAVCDIRR